MMTVVKMVFRSTLPGLLFACIVGQLALTTDVSGSPCGLCNTALCESEESLRERCAGGSVVSDPCGCCSQCGKLEGEVCGGANGYLGLCDYSLKCTADRSQFLSGQNISGVCTRKVCQKDCSKNPEVPVCGDDGRIYRNICQLRYFKHCMGRDVSQLNSFSVCNNACPELLHPAHGNITYSAGLTRGSVATFTCRPPYIVQGGHTRTCGIDRTWSNTIPVCTRPPNPCDTHTCVNFSVCRLDSQGRPQCVCGSQSDCPHDPVCASNGISYLSECHMKVFACERCQESSTQCSSNLYVQSKGKCPGDDDNAGKKRKR